MSLKEKLKNSNINLALSVLGRPNKANVDGAGSTHQESLQADVSPQANVSLQADVSPDNVCPDDEEIACFFDRRLSEQEKQAFFKRLNQCPESYRSWVDLAETLEYPIYEEKLKHSQNLAEEKVSLVAQLHDWVFGFQKPLLASVAGIFAIILVFNLQNQENASLGINEQLASSWNNHQQLFVASIDVKQYLPHGHSKSLNNNGAFAAKTAFATGFKKGMEQIAKKANLSTSQYDDLQAFLSTLPSQSLTCGEEAQCLAETELNEHLGQWSSQLMYQCQQPALEHKTQAYWQDQAQIAKAFEQQYQALTERFGELEASSQSMAKRYALLLNHFDALPDSQTALCEQALQLSWYAIQN